MCVETTYSQIVYCCRAVPSAPYKRCYILAGWSSEAKFGEGSDIKCLRSTDRASADQIRSTRTDPTAARLSESALLNLRLQPLPKTVSQWSAGWCYWRISILNRCFICLDYSDGQAEAEICHADQTSTLQNLRTISQNSTKTFLGCLSHRSRQAIPKKPKTSFAAASMTHPGTLQQ